MTVIHLFAALHVLHVPPVTVGQPASQPSEASLFVSNLLLLQVTAVHPSAKAVVHAEQTPPSTAPGDDEVDDDDEVEADGCEDDEEEVDAEGSSEEVEAEVLREMQPASHPLALLLSVLK